ncbi:MAG TPA: hypothetical protein VGO00_19720 [Kofleriaceae bacterium]|nr:hypothetical protein [Kofleriaceae bacterium]
MRAISVVFLLLAACAGAGDVDPDDLDAETGSASADASVAFTGVYVTHASTHYNGDITSLQLLPQATAGTLYVRDRCYRASCRLPVAETDRFDTYTSSSGKTYVRFYSLEVARDASGDLSTTPVIADVYEIQTTSYGVRLRKSYTTRWIALYRTTVAATCRGSGGVATGDACACSVATQVFAPGAGGCIAPATANESNCDDSTGLWTDDDATLVGAYCVCGENRFVDATGACTAI